MKNFATSFERLAQFFHLESWLRLLLLCVLVGVLSGASALIFDRVLKVVEHVLLTGWLFDSQHPCPAGMLVIVPALGGALAGALALWLTAAEGAGHGVDAVIRAFHRRQGVIPARIPLLKGLGALCTIGTGGSAGKEGPIIEIAAGFGSGVAGLLRLSVRDRRVLMLAGVAGAIGAIFKAPLGGALFAAEMLYLDPDFEYEAVIPGVISAVIAYSVFSAFDGYGQILRFQNPDGSRLGA